MRDTPSTLEVATDPQLCGLTVSPAQEVLLRAWDGLALDDAQLELFRVCTGRTDYHGRPFREMTVIAGARGGKDSRVVGPVTCRELVFGRHEASLGRGERATCPVINQDHRGTRTSFNYIRDYLIESPVFSRLVEEVLSFELRLANRTAVLCFPCTMTSTRGFSIPCGILNEIAHWRFEGAANADVEIQSAVRRGMVAFPSSRLVKVSTPYRRDGLLYQDYLRSWGQDDPDLLCWKAPTALMNPSIRPERLEQERRLDPVRFDREYGAEFGSDVDALFDEAALEAAVDWGVRERLPA